MMHISKLISDQCTSRLEEGGSCLRYASRLWQSNLEDCNSAESTSIPLRHPKLMQSTPRFPPRHPVEEQILQPWYAQHPKCMNLFKSTKNQKRKGAGRDLALCHMHCREQAWLGAHVSTEDSAIAGKFNLHSKLQTRSMLSTALPVRKTIYSIRMLLAHHSPTGDAVHARGHKEDDCRCIHCIVVRSLADFMGFKKT